MNETACVADSPCCIGVAMFDVLTGDQPEEHVWQPLCPECLRFLCEAVPYSVSVRDLP